MAEKESPVLLREAITQNKKYVDILLADGLPVVCVNRETKKSRLMAFKALYGNGNSFWLQKGAWEYFLTAGDFVLLRDKAAALENGVLWTEPSRSGPEAAEGGAETGTAETGEIKAEDGFGKEYEAIAAMNYADRLLVMENDKKRLDSLLLKDGKKEEVAPVLVDTARDSALINKVTILDAMQLADGEAKRHTQAMVDSTQDLVKSTTKLISPSIFNDDLINALVVKSNGTIIQHMTRTFLNGLAFLNYYNEMVSTSSIVNKIRISFAEKYREFYQQLLPHIKAESVNMEQVFMGSMRAISADDLQNWATGFLIHDIGKASAVEYHEGEEAYNRDIVMEHVKVGYTSVMNKTNYPTDAGIITGYHHEYYGDPGGYGYFRALLDMQKKDKPYIKQNYCITYELKPIQNFQALAFFPAKILEIIDVYDSVTDPNRKYRKAMTPEEALAMMRDEFIVKHCKIDPILFDLFTAFVRGNEKKK